MNKKGFSWTGLVITALIVALIVTAAFFIFKHGDGNGNDGTSSAVEAAASLDSNVKELEYIEVSIKGNDYYYEETDGEYVQRRKVKWLKHISRTAFSQGALYEVGSAMSFFMVKNYADEFLSALDEDFKKTIDDDSDDESVGATAEEIKESTKDFILKELSRKLKGYDLELFIKNLLEAMGYKAKVSPHGGDSGIRACPPTFSVQWDTVQLYLLRVETAE